MKNLISVLFIVLPFFVTSCNQGDSNNGTKTDLKSFIKSIEDPIFATEKQRRQEMWDIEGRLKNANQTFKFDIRPIKPVDNDRSEKIGYFNTKADKIANFFIILFFSFYFN